MKTSPSKHNICRPLSCFTTTLLNTKYGNRQHSTSHCSQCTRLYFSYTTDSNVSQMMHDGMHRMTCPSPFSSAHDEIFSMFGERGEQTIVVDGTSCTTIVHSTPLQRRHVASDCAHYGISCTDIPLLDTCCVHVGVYSPFHHF